MIRRFLAALLFACGAALSGGAAWATPPSVSLAINVSPGAVSTPQWVVAHQDGCFEISGTTTDFSCQMRWRDSYTADSIAIDVAWRPASGSVVPPITSVSFKNSAATCSVIPGTYTTNTTGKAIAKYLCPNLTVPASAFDIKFGATAQLVLVRTTELYGCANPCVAEAANATVTPKANGLMSITSGPTTGANEFVQSFAYGPSDSFSKPSATVISNAAYGVSSFLTQYQIASVPGTYTNSFTTSFAQDDVLQNIVAFKQNPTPPLSPPSILGQQIFTALDNQAAGSAVQGGVFAYAADYSLILSKPTLTVNPGGLLTMNPAGTGFTLASSNPPDGTYTGQLSVTQAGVTINQPITLIVEPPRTYVAAGCPTTPPPAAQRAGFTKIVNCVDPTLPFYQTLSNWMNCTDGSPFPPGLLFYPDWPALTCRDISFPIVNGQQVMEHHWHSTDDINFMRSKNSGASFVKITSTQCPGQGCPEPVNAPTANSYWEVRVASSPLQTDRVLVQDAPNIFIWTTCPAGVVNCGDKTKPEWSLVEMDFTESYGPRAGAGGSAFHWWNNKSFGYNSQDAGLANASQIASVIPGWTPVQMTSYGWLGTTDGVAGMRATSYINDLLIPSLASPIGRAMPGGSINPYDIGVLQSWDPLGFDLTSLFKEVSYWNLWLGGTFGLTTTDCQNNATCKAEGGQPDQINQFAYLVVYSCEEYATDPTCSTTKAGLAQ